MRKSVFLSLFTLSLVILFAFQYQSKPGKLVGKVTDKITGESIPYASILLKQKGAVITGANSDFEGNYTFENVSAGEYEVECSFLGYSKLSYEGVKITPDKTKTLNFELQEEAEMLQEVEIMEDASYSNGKAMHIRGSRKSLAYNYHMDSDFNTEEYNYIEENGFKLSSTDPLSTFSIDADGAAYANIRRFLKEGQMPPVDAVRIEEFINYFSYDYKEPNGDHPFSINTEVAKCPWNENNYIMHIGLKGMEKPMEEMPNSNIVFLLDVSGSMSAPNKLGLVKKSLKMMVNQLNEDDKIAIVVYAGASGTVLEPTPVKNKQKILEALQNLEAGGSTAGADGIELAYKVASKNFLKNGNNRVVLCTDGDFNVGSSSQSELIRLIEAKKESGIFLSVFGFGMGNLKDSKMEQLANKGNGTYNYIDNLSEAQKVFVNEAGATLLTIAKDVKIQVEFNPQNVAAYRLIGYENRLLNNEDFNDDTKDAGEIGAGHTITALYEIVPVGAPMPNISGVDDLKYQDKKEQPLTFGAEMATVKFRYKKPNEQKSLLLEKTVSNQITEFNNSSANMQFSSAVAAWGMLLRNSEFKGISSYDKVIEWGQKGKNTDEFGYRGEFIQLVRLSKELDERKVTGSVD